MNRSLLRQRLVLATSAVAGLALLLYTVGAPHISGG
jgi:hypothetical protein